VITQEEDGKHVFGLALAGMWMAVAVVVSSDSWGLCARNEDRVGKLINLFYKTVFN
jgi:hypothetical protein